MQVIILADGDVGTRAALDDAWPGWLSSDQVVIAADGGARHARPLSLRLDRWVGDGDSIDEAALAALMASGIPIERARPDKDESDTELAILAGLRLGPTAVTVLGALGGPRLDHALANLGLLAMPELRRLDVRLVAADARVRYVQAPTLDDAPVTLVLEGPVGGGVSLLPVGDDVHGVTTSGLAYPLNDESLRIGRTRGLSNVRTDAVTAAVTIRSGRLLVVETPATLTA